MGVASGGSVTVQVDVYRRYGRQASFSSVDGCCTSCLGRRVVCCTRFQVGVGSSVTGYDVTVQSVGVQVRVRLLSVQVRRGRMTDVTVCASTTGRCARATMMGIVRAGVQARALLLLFRCVGVVW